MRTVIAHKVRCGALLWGDIQLIPWAVIMIVFASHPGNDRALPPSEECLVGYYLYMLQSKIDIRWRGVARLPLTWSGFDRGVVNNPTKSVVYVTFAATLIRP